MHAPRVIRDPRAVYFKIVGLPGSYGRHGRLHKDRAGTVLRTAVHEIPGAVILGENTMGCATYGNCDIVEPLPRSGFTVRFGHSKFVNNVVRPIRECVGFFPDYWLKDPDFEEAIECLLEMDDR